MLISDGVGIKFKSRFHVQEWQLSLSLCSSYLPFHLSICLSIIKSWTPFARFSLSSMYFPRTLYKYKSVSDILCRAKGINLGYILLDFCPIEACKLCNFCQKTHIISCMWLKVFLWNFIQKLSLVFRLAELKNGGFSYRYIYRVLPLELCREQFLSQNVDHINSSCRYFLANGGLVGGSTICFDGYFVVLIMKLRQITIVNLQKYFTSKDSYHSYHFISFQYQKYHIWFLMGIQILIAVIEFMR